MAAIGDEAPNFDLSSTEDALLTLRDESARRTVVLYFFAAGEGGEASDRARRDLTALAQAHDRLRRLHGTVLAVSPAAMETLKALQRELSLPFPLLRDDRDFASSYGVVAAEDGQPPAPALAVVGRRQRLLWLSNPVASAEGALPQLVQLLKDQPSPTATYPRRVVNRWIERWVS